MPFVAEARLGVLLRQHARGDGPHAARGAGALRLGAREDRLARVHVERAPPRPGEVGLPAHGGDAPPGDQAAPALRQPGRPARRGRRALRSRAVALQRFEQDGLSRTSYRELRDAACTTAARLAALGVRRGDRVALSGAEPAGVARRLLRHPPRGRRRRARSIPRSTAKAFTDVLRSSRAKVALWDSGVAEKLGADVRAALPNLVAFDMGGFAEARSPIWARRPATASRPRTCAWAARTSRASSTRAARPGSRRACCSRTATSRRCSPRSRRCSRSRRATACSACCRSTTPSR